MIDNRIDVLIVYDIDTKTPEGRRRWRAICQMCKDYGQRVQYSVFECRLTQAQLEEMESRAVDKIDEQVDSLRFYVLRGGRDAVLRAHGIDRYQDYDAPLVL